MYDTARTLSKAMPHAQLRALEGQRHDVSPEVLAPVLVEFFAQWTPQPNPALKYLDVFVGEWNTEISSPTYPSTIIHGREKSSDGSIWDLDLNWSYTRIK
jgi:hypothetical protein